MTHFRDSCHTSQIGMQEGTRILRAWLDPWIEEPLAKPGG